MCVYFYLALSLSFAFRTSSYGRCGRPPREEDEVKKSEVGLSRKSKTVLGRVSRYELDDEEDRHDEASD